MLHLQLLSSLHLFLKLNGKERFDVEEYYINKSSAKVALTLLFSIVTSWNNYRSSSSTFNLQSTLYSTCFAVNNLTVFTRHCVFELEIFFAADFTFVIHIVYYLFLNRYFPFIIGTESHFFLCCYKIVNFQV